MAPVVNSSRVVQVRRMPKAMLSTDNSASAPRPIHLLVLVLVTVCILVRARLSTNFFVIHS